MIWDIRIVLEFFPHLWHKSSEFDINRVLIGWYSTDYLLFSYKLNILNFW